MTYFPENYEAWKRIAFLVGRANRVFITTHVNPDGDAIGSEVSFALFLRKLGKQVHIINHSATPEVYTFLDPDGMIEQYRENPGAADRPAEGDLVVFIDLGKIERAGTTGPFLYDTSASVVIFDHHPPEQMDADVAVITPEAASTGSLVYDFICSVDASLIDRQIAEAILTAIVTDTGYFRYTNTTSVTHRIAASLYEYGVKAADIRRSLEIGYSLSRQKLLGLALSTVHVTADGKIIYANISRSMFQKADADREHTEGIIDHLRVVKGVEIAILIIEESENHYKVSFRSRGRRSVNQLAAMLGGGGHAKAAGANLTGSLETVISIVLDAAHNLLKN